VHSNNGETRRSTTESVWKCNVAHFRPGVTGTLLAQSDDTFHAGGGTIPRTRSSSRASREGARRSQAVAVTVRLFRGTWADPVIALSVQMEPQTGLFRRPISCVTDGKIKARTAVRGKWLVQRGFQRDRTQPCWRLRQKPQQNQSTSVWLTRASVKLKQT
jgi:hypothetical protein